MRRRRIGSVVAVLMLVGGVHAQSLDEARAHIGRQDFAAAQATLEARLEASPDDEEARFLLARVLAWKGEPVRAIPLYRTLLARTPANVDYLLGLGQAQLWAGQSEDAIRTLEQAAALAPDYQDVQAALEQARRSRVSSAVATDADAGDRPAGSGASARPAADSRAGVEAAPAVPASSTSGADRRSVGVSHRRDWLDSGYADWTAYRLDVSDRRAGGRSHYGALVHEQRFGLSDRGIELGASIPVGRWSLQPEIGLVDDADFLPRRALSLRAERPVGAGWVAAIGARRSEYRDERVDRVSIGAERYVGAWRAGYTLNLTRIGSRDAAGHDVRIARSYGDGSEIGVQFVSGREETVLGTRIVDSDVRALSIGGAHAFSPQWRLLWNAGVVDQGALYVRRGLTLGLERRF